MWIAKEMTQQSIYNLERAAAKDRQNAIVINLLAPHEKVICKHFGCGKTLSLREQLLGELCISHSKSGLIVGKM